LSYALLAKLVDRNKTTIKGKNSRMRVNIILLESIKVYHHRIRNRTDPAEGATHPLSIVIWTAIAQYVFNHLQKRNLFFYLVDIYSTAIAFETGLL
jgi:hypothetical protein